MLLPCAAGQVRSGLNSCGFSVTAEGSSSRFWLVVLSVLGWFGTELTDQSSLGSDRAPWLGISTSSGVSLG